MLHTPHRGMWWSRPKVHSGFDKAWRNNGLNRRVMARVEKLFKDKEVDGQKVSILVTGAACLAHQTMKCPYSAVHDCLLVCTQVPLHRMCHVCLLRKHQLNRAPAH